MSLSHVDAHNRPTMVNVGSKQSSSRSAHARSFMRLPGEVLQLLNNGEINSKKGPVFSTAIVAGVMAAKGTSSLIPFCHPLFLDDCKISIDVVGEKFLQIDAQVCCHGKTGVEMEALTAASVAALTIYDMCKAMSHDLVIEKTFLVAKSGGKSDYHCK